MGLVCIQNSGLLVYSKSQKVSASYCLPFQHSPGLFRVYDQSFKSNLTGKEYKTISYDRLSCGSTNVIYEIHCAHCGLVYVDETGRSLRSRMNGHRSAIKKGGQSLLHRHFNNMWILKNSTSLLSSLDQLDVRTATSVQTFDFSTLYTSIHMIY